MKINALFFGITVSFLFVSCSNEQASTAPNSQLRQLAWLAGNWENETSEGRMGECWQVQNDTLFTGLGFFISGKDTVSSESVQLVQRGSDLFYIPTVKEQNDGKPVPFKLISLHNNEFIFENPQHDFPQRIRYKKLSADAMLAEISGKMNGEERTEQFPMHRVK